MKRLCILLVTFLLLPLLSLAQGENNIWTFYPLVSDVAFNFNTTPASLTTLPITSGIEGYSIAVSKPNGQLNFFVRLTFNTGSSYSNNIFKADGTPIPESNLQTGTLTDGCMPVVVPASDNPSQYYIFYSYSNGLLYSLLDMSLNNNQGGIINGQKDVVLAAYGSVTAQKMTAVKGCNGVWLVVRSRIANEYYSYYITNSGINTNAVISEVGNFAISDYNFNLYGFLKASQDGNKLAICGWTGVELYEFEKCSGKLKNARVIDTSGNGPFSLQNIDNHTRFQDVCFSPDASKLYVTQNYVNAVANPSDMILPGKLFQFDLDQGTLSNIVASKTLILTNQPSITPDIMTCTFTAQNPLGCLKEGPDGKLYIDNGSFTCRAPNAVPVGFNPGPAFHTIDQPNALGLLCQPHFNTLIVNSYTNNLGGDFYRSGDGGKSFLQQDIVTAPPTPDTIPGQILFPFTCFQDSMVLDGEANGTCYHWDNNSSEQYRSVFNSGTYYVSYFKDCTYTTDTFHVSMVHLPNIETYESCPEMKMGKAIATTDSANPLTLNYIWRMDDGSILRTFGGDYGDNIAGLNPATYVLQVTSSGGCDTTLHFEITALPKPEVVGTPADTTIRYGDSIQLRAAGALIYTWWPTNALDTAAIANPIARPLQSSILSVLGINEYGCMDTAEVQINIDFTMPDFVPNAFSPNGDGINDVFNISGITYQKLNQFKIFNRYGELIFATIDGHKGWDGTRQGAYFDVGTYFFLIELAYPDGTTKTYKGDVTLIR